MPVKAYCLADKQKHYITKTPKVLKVSNTSTGKKIILTGYSNKCVSQAGNLVKMSRILGNRPIDTQYAACPPGKSRNPLTLRCNLDENMGMYASRYYYPTLRRARSAYKRTASGARSSSVSSYRKSGTTSSRSKSSKSKSGSRKKSAVFF
jgi:hypothetical protein